ncbi:MAG TPA: 50S ribosomal protein L22 [Planctomycetes bacterium]|nr:50S ribosomal protein L22 [Planctomycetota bacterium]
MPDRWSATHKYARISPRKVRLVVDLIRGKFVDDAKETLLYSNKRAAYILDRVLASAVANATQDPAVDPTKLVVAEAYVNEAPRFKRWKAGPMGRARPIIRRNSHVHVVLEQKKQ